VRDLYKAEMLSPICGLVAIFMMIKKGLDYFK